MASMHTFGQRSANPHKCKNTATKMFVCVTKMLTLPQCLHRPRCRSRCTQWCFIGAFWPKQYMHSHMYFVF